MKKKHLKIASIVLLVLLVLGMAGYLYYDKVYIPKLIEEKLGLKDKGVNMEEVYSEDEIITIRDEILKDPNADYNAKYVGIGYARSATLSNTGGKTLGKYTFYVKPSCEYSVQFKIKNGNEVIYASPEIIPKEEGNNGLEQITLDKVLEKGEYNCTIEINKFDLVTKEFKGVMWNNPLTVIVQ